jgi:hypothetical protein
MTTLEDRIAVMDARLTGRIKELDSRLTGRLDALEAEMRRGFGEMRGGMAHIVTLLERDSSNPHRRLGRRDHGRRADR